jgi:hypothetical protein
MSRLGSKLATEMNFLKLRGPRFRLTKNLPWLESSSLLFFDKMSIDFARLRKYSTNELLNYVDRHCDDDRKLRSNVTGAGTVGAIQGKSKKDQRIANEIVESILQLLSSRKLTAYETDKYNRLKLHVAAIHNRLRCDNTNSAEVVGIPAKYLRRYNDDLLQPPPPNPAYPHTLKYHRPTSDGGVEWKRPQFVHLYGRVLREKRKEWQDKDTDKSFAKYFVKNSTPEELSALKSKVVEYLDPEDSELYKVVFKDGKIYYDCGRELDDRRYIFVLGTPLDDCETSRTGSSSSFSSSSSYSGHSEYKRRMNATLYLAKKKKGFFHHTSFLAGAAADCAGFLTVRDNRIIEIRGHSGHYKPSQASLDDFVEYLSHPNRLGVGLASTIPVSLPPEALRAAAAAHAQLSPVIVPTLYATHAAEYKEREPHRSWTECKCPKSTKTSKSGKGGSKYDPRDGSSCIVRTERRFK